MIFDGGLATYCQNTDAQIIPLAFVDRFVAQGNGYPGTNFANSCGDAVYEGPGYNGQNDPTQNHLLASCNAISSGIKTCQDLGKKVVLSLGGAMETYSLTSDDDATQMADFLWGAFGPLNSRWTDASQPRPFDVPATNDGTTETPALVNVIDGFDFDIEHITPGMVVPRTAGRLLMFAIYRRVRVLHYYDQRSSGPLR
jgi:chitinase